MFIVQLFLENGAEVNVEGFYGDTPLHEACRYGHITVVEALIKAGADINIKGQYEWSPVHLAVVCGHYFVIKALVQYDIDLCQQDTVRRNLNYVSEIVLHFVTQ